jgi:hypothetical protein
MTLRNRIEALLTIAAITVVIVSAKPACAADAFGYTATSKAPFSYIDISATGAAVLSGQDDSTAILALPFSFRFYGKDYTNLCVSTNGIASFGGCTNDDLTNLDLTAQSPAGNLPLVAPLWMDMTFAIPGSGSIHYQSIGTAGERQFVVQWHRAFALNLPTPFEFQLILFEGSGNIQFQYKTVENSSAAVSKGAGATVGIRGASGHANGNNLQWSYNAPVLNNGESILYAGDVTPPSIVPVVSGTLGNSGWYTGNVGFIGMSRIRSPALLPSRTVTIWYCSRIRPGQRWNAARPTIRVNPPRLKSRLSWIKPGLRFLECQPNADCGRQQTSSCKSL